MDDYIEAFSRKVDWNGKVWYKNREWRGRATGMTKAIRRPSSRADLTIWHAELGKEWAEAGIRTKKENGLIVTYSHSWTRDKVRSVWKRKRTGLLLSGQKWYFKKTYFFSNLIGHLPFSSLHR